MTSQMLRIVGLSIILISMQFSNVDSFRYKFELENRIENGNPAKQRQFPYQAGLMFKKGFWVWAEYTWCSGSIIGANWILTAAHCCHGKDSATIYLGSIERFDGFGLHSDEFIVHENYTNEYQTKNDIGLIKTETIPFSDKIQPIRLPRIAYRQPDFEGDKCIVSGWGSNRGDLKKLGFTVATITSNTTCTLLFSRPDDETLICAYADKKKYFCPGDSGDPLVHISKDDGRPIQIGISSIIVSGDTCIIKYPAGFTRVTYFLKWIEAITGISNY